MPKLKIIREDIIKPKELEFMVGNTPNLMEKTFIIFLYLYGCRVSEAIQISKGDFWIEKNKLYAKLITLKSGAKQKSNVIAHRILPLDMSTPYLNNVVSYLRLLSPASILFPMTRVTAWRRIKESNPNAWPHLFRHTRATRLAEKGASVFELMYWFGWSNMKMASIYVGRSPRTVQRLSKLVD